MRELDVRGYFWRPDQPGDRVPGQLVFSTASSGTLSLIGKLPGAAPELERLVGEAEGKDYTLEGCFETSTSFFPGKTEPFQSKQVLWVQRVLVGAAFGEDEPVTADRVSVKLAHLTPWARSAGYGDALVEHWEGHHGRWTISSDQVEPFSVSIPQGTLHLRQDRSITGDGVTTRSLSQAAWFHVDFNSILSLADALAIALDLQDLVSIGINRPAAFEEVQLWHPDHYPKSRDGERVRRAVDYLAEWRAQPDGRKDLPAEGDMAFTFAKLGGMDALARWVEVVSSYRSMLGQIMWTRYVPRMFVNDRLIDRVAALDGFYRKWRGRGPTLGTKLVELAEYAGDPFTGLVGSVDTWCRRVVDERNNIAHHKGRRVHESSSGMYFTAETLYWLFVLCMLRLINAPSPAFDHLMKCPPFVWVREELAARLQRFER